MVKRRIRDRSRLLPPDEKVLPLSESNDPNMLLGLTAQIVSAHVAHNTVSAESLPGLIQQVHLAMSRLGGPAPEPVPEKPVPAVPIKRSVFPDYIVCLEDGKKLKMLRRHLQSAYGMSPEQYRSRWGLPTDYPMVAPAYAAKRSSLAKQIGLGRKPEEKSGTTPARGRGRKAADPAE